MIEVYTDGSATTKDKPGGWACVLVVDGKEFPEHTKFGSIPNATNNDAELEAAIQGLARALAFIHFHTSPYKERPEVVLCSDSEIVLNWASGRYRFKQTAKMHKYDELRELVKRTSATTRWVEGHAGHEFNEKCDKLAGEARDLAMGRVPRKKSTKSTLMLQAIKEIAKIASENSFKFTGDPSLDKIHKLCIPFLGKNE